MSINTAMNIARQGLSANQTALNVVSNNVANINTEGYSKQRVNFQAMYLNGKVNFHAAGLATRNNGVQIASILRYSNDSLQAYARQQNSDSEGLLKQAEAASTLEALFDELGETGLTASFNEFYAAATVFNQHPTDITARRNYIEKTKDLALRFNNYGINLEAQRKDLVGEGTMDSLLNSQTGTTVDALNKDFEKLVEINKQILKSSISSDSGANILDQRDALLNSIAEKVNVNIQINDAGTASVSIENYDIVRNAEFVKKMSVAVGTEDNPAIIQLRDAKTDVVVNKNINEALTGGKLSGILAMGGTSDSELTVKGAMDKLNQLANGFAEIMNDIQVTSATNGAMAIDSTKTPKELMKSTEAMFKTKDGSATFTAKNIMVNDELIKDPYKIAGAKVDDPDHCDVKDIGNSKNTLAILNTRNTNYASLDGQSPEDFLASLAADIGIKAESINTRAESQSAIAASAKNQLGAETGVDLYEEMTDMIKFQRAYEASARVFNTCNQMLDTLYSLGT